MTGHNWWDDEEFQNSFRQSRLFKWSVNTLVFLVVAAIVTIVLVLLGLFVQGTH